MMSLLYESTVVIVTIKPGKINHRKTLSSRSIVQEGTVYSRITVKQVDDAKPPGITGDGPSRTPGEGYCSWVINRLGMRR